MTDVASDLARYTRWASEQPWVWGGTDCTSWLAPYVEARLGRPVGGDLRARAGSARAARRLVLDHGGLVGLVERLLGPLGCARTPTPHDGDVGVVSLIDGRGRRHRVSALHAGGRWVVRTGDGIAALSIAADAAWRLPPAGGAA